MELLFNQELSFIVGGDAYDNGNDYDDYSYEVKKPHQRLYTQVEVEDRVLGGLLFGTIMGCIFGAAGILG